MRATPNASCHLPHPPPPFAKVLLPLLPSICQRSHVPYDMKHRIPSPSCSWDLPWKGIIIRDGRIYSLCKAENVNADARAHGRAHRYGLRGGTRGQPWLRVLTRNTGMQRPNEGEPSCHGCCPVPLQPEQIFSRGELGAVGDAHLRIRSRGWRQPPPRVASSE
ncbi:hypothetical protein AAFF_G00373480 [Aldrovandia affinis]|uniref:Uncharacterized protein n=1 Tax=Aldrovandia affinis TaxID=143900 RepID=A0AAD7SGL7_9TELE|nr:hypothetical protein AAFF_G00373480 [Aldrovandia affinis]